MKEYKCKIMNKAMIKEITELWDNGHAEAIAAYGWECANAAVEGYKKGYAVGTALGLMLVGLGAAGIGYAIREIQERRALRKKTEEFIDYVDNLKPGELKLEK